jgi:hypothetical protein
MGRVHRLLGLNAEVEQWRNEVVVRVSFTDSEFGEGCAKRLFSELTSELIPDPEDEEETKLEPEEITADAEEGKE